MSDFRDFRLSRWARFCWWLAERLAPKDGSDFGPRIFGRSVKLDPRPEQEQKQ